MQHSIFDWPSMIQSLFNSCDGNVVFSPQLNGCCFFATKPNKLRDPAVKILFMLRSPTTIGWLVISVVVDSIKGKPWFECWSHVLEERFKTVEPSGAHFYSATSVFGVTGIAFPVASVSHGRPSLVKRMLGQSMALAPFRNRLHAIASAAFSSLKQDCLRLYGYISAIAQAKPFFNRLVSYVSECSGESGDRKISESASSLNTFATGFGANNFNLSHDE